MFVCIYAILKNARSGYHRDFGQALRSAEINEEFIK